MESSGCTPKKRRRRSMRNLRRQSTSACGDDLDSTLLGTSSQQGPPPDLEEAYGSLWLELDDFERRPKSKSRASKLTGRRSSFGISQENRMALPLWEQPAPFQQPESVRFAQNMGEASPQMSPAFRVESADLERGIMHPEEDPHDTSLNTAFSQFSIRSEEQEASDQLQAKTSPSAGFSLSAASPNTALVKRAASNPFNIAQLHTPSPVGQADENTAVKLATELPVPEAMVFDDSNIIVGLGGARKRSSPQKFACEAPCTCEMETMQAEHLHTSDVPHDGTAPNSRTSLLTKLKHGLSHKLHKFSSRMKTTTPDTPSSCDTQEKQICDHNSDTPSTNFTEGGDGFERERKETDLGGLDIPINTNEHEPENQDESNSDISAGPTEGEYGEGDVDFDLIFNSPCSASPNSCDRLPEVEVPLPAEPASTHWSPADSPGDSPASCRRPLLLSDVETGCHSPMMVQAESSPSRNVSRSPGDLANMESKCLNAVDPGESEGKKDGLTAATTNQKPRQLRKSRRTKDLVDLLLRDETITEEESLTGSEDISSSASKGKRRIYIRGRRRCINLAPIDERADEKPCPESAMSETAEGGLEGYNVLGTISSSSDNSSDVGSSSVRGFGRYQRKRKSTDLRLTSGRPDNIPTEDVPMTQDSHTAAASHENVSSLDATQGRGQHLKRGRAAELSQISVPEMEESESKTDVSFPEMKNLAQELGSIEEIDTIPDLPPSTSGGKRQYKKRKRELADLIMAKENVGIENSDMDVEMANQNERRVTRRRRWSFSIPSEYASEDASDVPMTDIQEESSGNCGTTTSKLGTKRLKTKELSEEEVEDLYRNKNYKLPELRSWETIFESPEQQEEAESSSEQEKLMSKRRYKRVITFVDNDPVKLRRRLNKAVKKGWTPCKKSKITHEDVRQKLDRLEASLSRAEDIW